MLTWAQRKPNKPTWTGRYWQGRSGWRAAPLPPPCPGRAPWQCPAAPADHRLPPQCRCRPAPPRCTGPARSMLRWPASADGRQEKKQFALSLHKEKIAGAKRRQPSCPCAHRSGVLAGQQGIQEGMCARAQRAVRRVCCVGGWVGAPSCSANKINGQPRCPYKVHRLCPSQLHPTSRLALPHLH